MKKWIFGMAALAAAMCFGATTEDGVTKERRGALGPNDTVVTDVDATGIVAARTYTKAEVDRRIATNAPVRSVNGKTGRVVLGANDVGALPNNRDGLKANANFRNAVWDVQIKSGGGGGCDTNTVDALANSAVVTNALTVATTNRVALLESLKADKSALKTHVENTNNPHAVTAAQVGAVGIGEDIQYIDEGGYNGLSILGSSKEIIIQNGYSSILDCRGITIYDGTLDSNRYTALGKYDIALIDLNNPEQNSSLYFPEGQQGTIALQDWQSLSAMLDSADATTLAENPTFSNAVMAVGLNIDTNSVAVLNDIAKTFGGFPLGAGETATTVGGLLAALAAAIAWLKKNKVGSFKSVGGATATVENGVAKLDDFFTESNSLLTATIDARLPYPLYTVPSTGLLKDRAINTTSLASVTVPDNFTDLLVRASVTSSLAVTMSEATTKYGDTFPGEAGEYLITITKTGAAEAYVRTIKLEEVANA